MKGIIHITEWDGAWRARLDIMESLCKHGKCGARPRTLCTAEGESRADCLRNMAASLELLDKRKEKV